MVVSKKSTIVVGLSLTEGEDKLLKSAVNLARKTESRLVLAHVTLPLQAYMYADKGGVYHLANYESNLEELSETSCLKKLSELKSSITELDHHSIETMVVHNDPTLGLSQLAKELKAGLLICGFQSENTSNSLLGASTAVSLMSNAPCPVLTLPVEREFQFVDKIVFADDLNEETQEALTATCEFMQSVGLHELYHAHIKNISEREIDHMVETVNSAIALGTMPSNKAISQRNYMEETKGFLAKQLTQRFQSVADHLRQDIKYETLIDFGSPLLKIKVLLENLDPDIVVFGPHKFFHKTTWRFGKLSYHSMLSLNCGVLIIPEKISD